MADIKKIVIEPQFDYAAQFSEGLAKIKTQEGWGYIDKNGSIVIEPVFKDTGRFSEGLAWVNLGRLNGGGYIDKTGNLTNIKPSEGVNGFIALDWIVKVGIVVKNNTNPVLKDIKIRLENRGQI